MKSKDKTIQYTNPPRFIVVQQDATIAFFIRNGFTLHVSGDNLTHHQSTMLYMATGELAHLGCY